MNSGVPRFRRTIAVLLLATLTGCFSWRPANVSPQTLVSQDHPESVRLQLANGVTIIIDDPRVRNDSILTADVDQFGAVRESGVPLRDINSIETRQFSTGKTIVFIAATMAVVLGWAGIATSSSGGTQIPPGPEPKG